MNDEIKPIKRGIELAPLSREHHEGLLFVWKIRQGLKNETDIERIKKYIFWHWQNHIKPHFYQEEKILLPFLSKDDPMAIRLKNEHENIREFILNLDAEADKNTVSMLADLINDHIRFEERQVFNHLENTLTPAQLTSIFQQIEEHPLTCNTGW